MRATILVIAGSDSSGGAGVDADRDALESLGVPALEVVTAWTEQDEGGVRATRPVAPGAWLEEARSLARELGGDLGAVKFGLLPGAGAIEAAAELVADLRRADPGLPIVVDPVIASSSGHRFLDAPALEVLRGRLLPAGLLWTPNLLEAAEVLGRDPTELEAPDARLEAARSWIAAGAAGVVLTGGHGREDPALDLCLERGGRPRRLEHPRLPGATIRGSGCRFASALAAGLARGRALPLAAQGAAELVLERLRASGAG